MCFLVSVKHFFSLLPILHYLYTTRIVLVHIYMKKLKFKSYLNTKIKEAGLKYLLTLKNKHTKSDNLCVASQMQSYLISNKLSLSEKQLLFKFRTRTYNCRANYKTQYGSNLACLIFAEEDTQIHLLQWKKTAIGVELEGVQYSDIFSSIEKQVRITKVLKKITSNRETIMKKSSITGSQAHPSWCLVCI